MNSSNSNITFRIIKGNRLKLINKEILQNFASIVYNNFISLSDYPNLKHTHEEIQKILTSSNLIMICAYSNNKMIGYIIGESMRLDDNRYVLFISYLYVGLKYRRQKLGTKLLHMITNEAIQNKINYIMLIADTEDSKIVNFYMMEGFMYDAYLRRYDKYDVFTLDISV